MEAYTALAKYYDRLMTDFNYEDYFNFINQYVKGCGVDLCCGSGTMTIKLAKVGNKMIGVDYSNEMLNDARNKAKKNACNVLWVQSDVSEFELENKVDFITCVCDGFNYINKTSLKKTLNSIPKYILQNGYFIFDISSEYKLKNILGNNLFYEDYEDLTYYWTNKLKKDSIKMELSFFEKSSEPNNYKRFDEEHTQYIYSKEFLLELLEKNFEVQIFDGTTFEKVQKNTNRLLFVCKKR